MAIALQPLQSPAISSLDALWALIQSQPKKVRDALLKRMCEADKQAETRRQEEYVRETLTRAIADVHEAERTGKKQMSFDEFISEMRNEEQYDS